MKNIGFVGWRGMVGSVLMNRMQEESDFDYFHSTFLSTSQIGKHAPNIQGKQELFLQDAYDIELLNSLDIIITCQGSAYSNIIYPILRKTGWAGYWIDSASSLRMNDDAIIILDPVNQVFIEKSLNNGIKTFIGGNCTVSLMLMSLGGLFSQNLIEWVFASTYQAASGYGARAIRELLIQMGQVYNTVTDFLTSSTTTILDIEHAITKFSRTDSLLVDCFKVPLVGNVIPWIGNYMCDGQTQEEWKGQAETNKILNTSESITVDSLCVRVGSLRCHSQAFILKLKKNMCLTEIEELIQSHNEWVEVIPNDMKQSLENLTPIMVSGTLKIPIGRLRKLHASNKHIAAFSVGDQLLWGAAEPLRRMLRQLL
ncbi:aspartate-semialdehyde dehydrogenase [Blochmannia endosymbiont of Camponotus sp.]|uniref:aspartate-semialdehyde dehydrogenase n=1 Tax=Blochmannia endosymbiont of Camponotus sp. TaxID=700220 RepID=UPI00202442D4|nr:aspartate-semialdehyde dehydrogenase [Blochmannia endosymbiont of Camponotus sp.]URJ31261.1 aspartate-semialdehyde dehydrogenase [Blochmannia endosymbiont of Camponotus sp.]